MAPRRRRNATSAKNAENTENDAPEVDQRPKTRGRGRGKKIKEIIELEVDSAEEDTQNKSETDGETASHISKKLKTTANALTTTKDKSNKDKSQLSSTDIDYVTPIFPPIQSKKRKELPDQNDDVQNQAGLSNKTNENLSRIIEKLEETNRILDHVRSKQQLLESNHNAESEKRERFFGEFKQFTEEKFQSYERMIAQLQNQKQEEDRCKIKVDQISMLERDLHRESEEKAALEQDLKKEKEESRKLIDQLKKLQSIENSKKAGELKQTIKRLECELNQERENCKRFKRELDKIPTTDAKQMEISAQLRLFEDLTNLLIQNVKFVSQNERSFTCILSGRNGSLVFKLTFNGNEYLYEPSINPERDARLLSILPDYLQEEITFKTEKLDLFFWRIQNFLQKSESD